MTVAWSQIHAQAEDRMRLAEVGVALDRDSSRDLAARHGVEAIEEHLFPHHGQEMPAPLVESLHRYIGETLARWREEQLRPFLQEDEAPAQPIGAQIGERVRLWVGSGVSSWRIVSIIEARVILVPLDVSDPLTMSPVVLWLSHDAYREMWRGPAEVTP